ncbi:hypothetical protein D5086_003371 [Populus alba]|uniref:Uncharacterized protein n=1 Tax=Populus alba TaxID=43335 RepID=A0ACC4D6C7_POPAL
MHPTCSVLVVFLQPAYLHVARFKISWSLLSMWTFDELQSCGQCALIFDAFSTATKPTEHVDTRKGTRISNNDIPEWDTSVR